MTKKLRHVRCAMTLALVLLAFAACSRQVKENEPMSTRLNWPGPLENSTLEAAYFETDSSVLTQAAKADLDRAANFIKAQPRTYFRIEGNTDERGSESYNKALGQRRAEAVKDYLVSRGVDSTHLATVSNGESTPLMKGHDEKSWARNRRAVPIVVDESKVAR